MKSMYDVLKRPLVTEKSSALNAESNKVTFEVAMGANKHEIKEAVEKLLEVGVEDVRTMIYRGKTKRVGKHMGRQRNWKKAVVTLVEGAELDIFNVGQEGEVPEGLPTAAE